ncbi:MAG TPA: hypothetical protein VFB34_09640 [Chloroflexota bacterium]|nr:hypothetical protein [Chloroflexota bacterium]
MTTLRLAMAIIAALVASSLISGMPTGIALGAASGRTAHPLVFSVQDLGVLNRGIDAEAYGLDDHGEVTGQSQVVTGRKGHQTLATHAFLFARGKLRDLGAPPNESDSFGRGISSSGWIAAFAKPADRQTVYPALAHVHGSRVTWTKLAAPAGAHVPGEALGLNGGRVVAGWTQGSGALQWKIGSSTKGRALKGGSKGQADAISASGDIAGYVVSGSSRAIVWPAGSKAVYLPSFDGDSDAYAIARSSSGTIYVAGTARIRGHMRAVLWKLRRTTGHWAVKKSEDLGSLPGFADSLAYGVNGSGWVVGTCLTPKTRRAFLWHSGSIRALDSMLPGRSGWDLTVATAVNSKGQIVGYGAHHGQERPFLLTKR